jgi:hypothetical protein
MTDIRNLDDSVTEYFDFIVGGHTYRFRHLTVDEITAFKNLGDDNEKTMAYIASFVSPITQGAPEFSETLSKMIVPKLKKFMQMIKEEFGS